MRAGKLIIGEDHGAFDSAGQLHGYPRNWLAGDPLPGVDNEFALVAALQIILLGKPVFCRHGLRGLPEGLVLDEDNIDGDRTIVIGLVRDADGKVDRLGNQCDEMRELAGIAGNLFSQTSAGEVGKKERADKSTQQ